MATQQQPILIAVLGVTGAGKSTFINKASKCDPPLTVGMTMRSCTQTIANVKTRIDGKEVILIDTPGFDDTERQDADILEDIAKWLSETHSAGVLLTGIILLQPVSSNRVYGSEARRTRLFKKICGPNAFSNVILATTMWSDLVDERTGQNRVDERKASADFWGDMLKHGAKVERHDNSVASAHRIIRLLLNKRAKPLQMQEELLQHDGELYATSAAQQLHDDLGKTSEKQSRELEKLMHEIRLMRQDRAAMLQEMQALRAKVEDLERQKEKLENARFGVPASNAYVPRTAPAAAAPVAAKKSNHNTEAGCGALCCACLCCAMCCTVM